jgi:DNA helicase-2/ATP-dependent DNA helicase PcrA
LIKKQNIDGSVTTTIIDFKSAEDAQTYDVSIEQLSLYAIGYKELSGENADFLEIYNMDQNKPQREEIQFQDLNDMKKKIAEAAANIKENNLPKTVNAELCQSCRQIKICSGCTK